MTCRHGHQPRYRATSPLGRIDMAVIDCHAPSYPGMHVQTRTTADHGRDQMQTRRDFIRGGAGAAGTVAFIGCDLLKATHAQTTPRRREVAVSGRRVKTVDIHAHCAFPEVNALMGVKIVPPTLAQTPERIEQMDAQGIDVAA